MLCKVSYANTEEVEDIKTEKVEGVNYGVAEEVECEEEDHSESDEDMLDESQVVNNVMPRETDHLESKRAHGVNDDDSGLHVYDVKAAFNTDVKTYAEKPSMTDGK